MNNSQTCGCGAAPALAFSCSGAADTAEIADRAVRALHRERTAKMYCLTGIGGDVQSIVENTRASERILVVDGCPLDCARKTMERAGIDRFIHLRVTDLGMNKGQTEVTPERITAVAEKARELLG